MKSRIRDLRDWVFLGLGLFEYGVTGNNRNYSYQALIRLYCKTQGRSSRWLGRFWGVLNPPKTEISVNGVLGDLDSHKLDSIAANLNRDGYHIFENLLSDQDIEELLKFTKETPAVLRRHDNDPINAGTRREIYDPANKKAVRYDYSSDDLMKSPIVQKLVFDPTLLAVARSYLKAEPEIDIVTMWWHTDFHHEPDSNAAQLYHFDMDRIRWLKFFVYLTDVNENSGPHCFIRGTHSAENIPREILNRGYVRISDNEIEQKFKPQDIKAFTGRRGTIIAENTCGLHKGQVVKSGHRLVFQLEYTISLFGSPGFKKINFGEIHDIRTREMMKTHPRVYKNFEKSR